VISHSIKKIVKKTINDNFFHTYFLPLGFTSFFRAALFLEETEVFGIIIEIVAFIICLLLAIGGMIIRIETRGK